MQKITTHFTNFIGKQSKKKQTTTKLLHKYSQIHHIPYEDVKKMYYSYILREKESRRMTVQS